YAEPRELGGELLGDALGEQRRDGISELELLLAPVATDHVVVGEGHQPLELGDAQATVLPVEGTHPWAGLPLDCRRGPVRMELEQEAPVAAAPLEPRLGMAALGGQEEVVVAGRDLAQSVRVGALYDLLRLGWVRV